MPAAAKKKPRALFWVDQSHADLARHVMEVMSGDISVVAVGSESRGPNADFSAFCQGPITDDLRQLLVEHEADYVLFATDTRHDAEDVILAMERGMKVLTLKPLIVTLSQWSRYSRQLEARLNEVHVVPDLESGQGWSSAAEPGDVIGSVESIGFTSLGTQSESPLSARLFEGWRLILKLGDLPDAIDASISGPLTEIPETMHSLTGHMSIHARLPRGCSASMQLSDRAGHTSRQLVAIGRDARFRVDDFAYELSKPDGELIDASAAPAATKAGKSAAKAAAASPPVSHAPPFAGLIAGHWRRLLKMSATGLMPEHYQQILACCEATLLSARTYQAEDPAKVLSMRS